MDSYNIILSQFEEIGYKQSARLDEYEVNKVLDKILQRNSKNDEIFNRDIAQQIFEQTPKNEDQEVTIKDFISTILEAHILLKKYIHEHRDKIKMETNQQEKIELTTQLQQYEQDYELLTIPFGIQGKLKPSASIPESRVSKSDISDFFADSSSVVNESQSLKITFIIAAVGFLLEFFLMFEKHHFLSMLTYVAVLSIFLLNYFDKTYIRVSLSLLAISVFFDFLWIILQADHYWNISGPSQHSNEQTGFFRFIYIMTLLSMVTKAAMAFFLFPYRLNNAESCKVVRVFNIRFELSASQPSPLSALVQKSMA